MSVFTRYTLKTKVWLGFGSAIIIVLVTGIITWQNFTALTKSLDFLSKPDLKLSKINSILSDLSVSENHIRSYFISKDVSHLKKYKEYAKRLDANLDSLITLTAHKDSGNIAKIKILWKEKKIYTEQLIKLSEKKDEKKIPDGILKKLNDANPEIPTIIITKVITIKTENTLIPKSHPQKEEEDKQSLIGKIFKKKKKEGNNEDSITYQSSTSEETETVIDTFYSGKNSNALKEAAFKKILSGIRKLNYESRLQWQQSEAEVIEKDLSLIEYIRTMVIELKNQEQNILEANIVTSKKIVEDAVVRIFIFGATGISALVIFAFLIMNDIRKSTFKEKQLLNEKIRAEEFAKTKQDFLATMSHEIRTPLNSIIGFTEQLSQTHLQNKQKYFLKAISSSTTHLLSLVNDLLDLSRIETGKIDFENIRFNLCQVIEEVYDIFVLKAGEKNLQFTYTINHNELWLNGDALRLKQILLNLLSNAVKFTNEGSIKLICEATLHNTNTAEVVFTVKDTGIGIPASKLNTIFDSFSQADSSITRRYGGSGLGLAISKRLVELQRGTIEVNSIEGKGSEFTIKLTYTQSTDEPVSTYADIQDTSLLEGLKVLVVEDDEFNLLLYHTILNKWRMRSTIVSSGEEALEAIAANKFDLVLTDIHMSGMSGLELLKKIRENPDPKISELPVIAITAGSVKGTIDESGFQEVLYKPFLEEQLTTAILKIWGAKINTESVDLYNPSDTIDDFLKFSGGDPEVTDQIIDAFISNYSTQLSHLQKSFQENDWDGMKSAAHKLISGFGYLRNERVVSLLERIEHLLNEANPDCHRLKKLCDEIIQRGQEQLTSLNEQRSELKSHNSIP